MRKQSQGPSRFFLSHLLLITLSVTLPCLNILNIGSYFNSALVCSPINGLKKMLWSKTKVSKTNRFTYIGQLAINY